MDATDKTTPPTVAELITQKADDLTASERKLAQALLGHYPMAGLETVATFAERCGVSAPTVLRFAGKLGFESYPEMQSRLRGELEARLQSPLTRSALPRAAVAASGHPMGELLHHMIDAITSNIRLSLSNIAPTELEGAISLLADQKRAVYVLGGRFSSALAVYAYEHLRSMRANVRRVSGQNTKWTEDLLDIGKRDVLLVFDVRRYQNDVITFAETASNQGAKVILFTDQWLSPIARFARHVFPVRIETATTWDSAAASMALLETLLEGVGRLNPDHVRDRIEHLERLRRRPPAAE
ncbi:MurR/RpiR family transcriptional regulator [Thalassospira marina]|uniref:RpiR family transcriptional regulator n=1 Tax=Thalassospira marina TaxID=2048283 RepID=A0A2N3KUY3_9PROT|nr:MurR/RpiR family transcriptional regulator [Thalassospira marina]AUG52783.1 RpiR family transcriptional regulator [Thalassospira marina]PKR54389.1 RpiR family transcriptional regulator [Thalassospira marina]